MSGDFVSYGIEVLVGITFQDGDRFNSCQVIYSQFGLAIHQNDHQARRRFVKRAQNEIAVVPDFHKRILFSDEAHFWLNGYVNNGRIWSLVHADKPQTLDHLEDNIRRVIADIRPQMLEKVIENWTSRLDYIRAIRGSPMPEIIFKICQVIYSQFGLAIHQNDHQARRRFVERAQNEIAVVPDFHKRILFSDEAHFWLNGYVNKQNCHIWSEANPQVYVETPLHPEKLTVWCALWAGGIIGPYFFKNDEGHNVTVNGDRYRAMITNFFIPELNNHDVQELYLSHEKP
ncbi:uncharacterized protein TNCV_4598351 [Trichonephila clavipes]|nr:uncharacterized protein TNCV_4598351 [Trichonephila clavipes]